MKLSPLPSPSSLLGLVLTLLVLVLAMLISGCGPGVIGTGTGQSATLEDFGATPAPLCESDLAPQLRCPSPGTQVTWFADSATAARTSVRIEGNRAQLDASCANFQFSGEWGKVGGQGGRFFGNAITATGSVPAVLVVTPTGSGLLVQLQTAQGAVLMGPLLLVSVPGQPAPAVCG
jgi:hypothetical protein